MICLESRLAPAHVYPIKPKFMNRLTRLGTHFNSPESLRFIAPKPFRLYRPALSISPIRRFSTSGITGRPIKLDPIRPEMDPNPPEPYASTGEDFVHIENPNPNTESLSESIVNVERDDVVSRDIVVSGSGEGESSGEKNVLPEELSRSVMVLTCESSAEGGTCDVYLVGTAHVSQESCREVQAVISFLKPEVVFLELCASRVALLAPQNLKVPTMGEMIEMWKKKYNIFGILYSLFLAKVADKLEVSPGAEFRVAYEEAMKYGGRVILGDRPVQVTIQRTWAKMPLWHKTKLLYSLLFQAFFLPSPEDINKMLKEMDDVDMLTLVIQEMSKEFPTLMETLVHERDQYMSYKLLNVASIQSSVVAVVGKGHLNGIKEHWKQPVKVRDILEIPLQKPGISAVKVLTSLGVVVTGVAIISAIYLGRRK